MKTTLKNIRSYDPCTEGWEKLLKSLNKTQADDEPIDIRYIIKSNGIADAVWCLRAVDDQNKVDLFKRRVALINIKLIKPYTDKYDLIVRYLETGDESIREEVEKAARDAAACDVARDAFAAVYAARAAVYAAADDTRVAARAVAYATDANDARDASAAAWEQIEKILIEIIEEGEEK